MEHSFGESTSPLLNLKLSRFLQPVRFYHNDESNQKDEKLFCLLIF